MSLKRRDIMKLCGAAFVASLVPDQLIKLLGARDLREAMERLDHWDLPAQAASNADYTQAIAKTGKRYWNGQLNTNLPDMYASHGFPRLPQFSRTTYGGAVVAEWPDDTTLPNEAWYALFAASFLADTNATRLCPQGWFIFDLESFDVGSQAARIASATLYTTFHQNLSAVLPNFRFVYYQYPAHGDWFNAIAAVGSAGHATLQAEFEDYAEMYSVVHAVCPSMYVIFNRANDNPANASGWLPYTIHRIQEVRRMVRAYGTDQPVWPFISFAYNGNLVDHDIFARQVLLCDQLADGFVYWGGFGVDWATESTYPWWTNVMEPFLLGRKPGPLLL